MQNPSRLLLLLCCCLISACQSISYYHQAAQGQLAINWHKTPTRQLIEAEETPLKLKKQLQLVNNILRFSEEKLSLPVKNNFSTFVDLKRPFIVWNVFATPKNSLQAKTWCFPIAGCVAYRGYFNEREAHHYAKQLEEKGYDTYVGGVRAYSTLGWFNDPLLNTFIYQSDINLAALIIHELAHRIIYVKDDTSFNESFATAVEKIGVKQWLIQSHQPEKMQEYLLGKERTNDFLQLTINLKNSLENIYRDTPDKDITKSAEERIEQFIDDYQQFKQQWDNYDGYDNWVYQDFNNAKLVSVGLYHDKVEQFEALFLSCENNFERFYHAVRQLAKYKKDKRDEMLLDAEECFK